jgi:hypothetical protein
LIFVVHFHSPSLSFSKNQKRKDGRELPEKPVAADDPPQRSAEHFLVDRLEAVPRRAHNVTVGGEPGKMQTEDRGEATRSVANDNGTKLAETEAFERRDQVRFGGVGLRIVDVE